ncbi:hypothetical protein JW752_01220 [Candidatus Peregrinibacteria bacterium]|nr:hypothetical protein [Candidatus Peregrinibacteria bacterium]
MKAKDILIATALILTLSSLLNGCALLPQEKASEATQPPAPKINVEKLAEKARAAQKSVNLAFKAEREEGQVTVTINLNNPEGKPITSVQSWLSFDPNRLYGKEIKTDDSAFSLIAPYNNTFDNENGLMMLGRANPDPLTDKTIKVAEVVFDVRGEGATMIDVYDYQDDLSGHASANSIIEGKPYNLLKKPNSPALIIEK